MQQGLPLLHLHKDEVSMYAVEMNRIIKAFGPLIANDKVDFCVETGEIHALLGENGAGKTTLMRILYGLYQADSGNIKIHGNQVKISSPSDAIKNGIGMVTQHFTLVQNLTVAENLLLSEKKGFLLKINEEEKRILEVSDKFNIPIHHDTIINKLSVGEKQRVEIFKALFRNARILIMDEPTAVLIPQEIDQLMDTLINLRNQGFSIVFISHKLKEVMKICDKISVLRDGKLIGTVRKEDVTQNDLAKMMVGRATFGVIRQDRNIEDSERILKVDNVFVNDKSGHAVLENISFDIKAGEIFGIAGVSGNGQTELAQLLSGILHPKSGSILYKGNCINNWNPSDFVKSGIGRIPEDRHTSVVSEMTLAENMVMESIEDISKHGLVDTKKMMDLSRHLITKFNIKAKPNDLIRTLSGGNMQKAILARVLSRDPNLIIVSQPTRGLDVGATEYIRQKLIEQTHKGSGVMLFSEELDEIMALSDRIAVMFEGKIMGIFLTNDITLERIGLLMAGGKL